MSEPAARDAASATVAKAPAAVVSFYDRFAPVYELWGNAVDGRELWGPSAEAGLGVTVEAWESYLDA